jgi:hypothetical protein
VIPAQVLSRIKVRGRLAVTSLFHISTLNVFCNLKYLCREIAGDNASMFVTLNIMTNCEIYDKQLHTQIRKFTASYMVRPHIVAICGGGGGGVL